MKFSSDCGTGAENFPSAFVAKKTRSIKMDVTSTDFLICVMFNDEHQAR
jgi:hypothetical protein